MRKIGCLGLIAGAMVMAWGGAPARADITFVSLTFPGGTNSETYDSHQSPIPYTWGYQFTPLTNITVTSLGYWDYFLDYSVGPSTEVLNDDHNVAIFQQGNPTPVASAVVLAGLGQVRRDSSGYIFQSLAAPVNLTAGTTYYLSAAVPGTGSTVDDYILANAGIYEPTPTYAADITKGVGTYDNGGLSGVAQYPLFFDGNTDNYLDGNFQFVVTDAPEPASVAALAVGAAGLVARRRRVR